MSSFVYTWEEASLSALSMMNDSWICWLTIRKLWKLWHTQLSSPQNFHLLQGSQLVETLATPIIILSLGYLFLCYPNPSLVHLCSFLDLCVCLKSFCNLSLNPRCSRQLESNESLMGLRKFYPAPTTCSQLVLTAYVSKQVQFHSLLFCNYFMIASISHSNSKLCLQAVKNLSLSKNLRGAWETNRRRKEEDELQDRGRKKSRCYHGKWGREREGRSRERKCFGFLTDGSQSRVEIPQTFTLPSSTPDQFVTPSDETLLCLYPIPSQPHPIPLYLSHLSFFHLLFTLKKCQKPDPFMLW